VLFRSQEIKVKAFKIICDNSLLEEKIMIRAKTLTPEEAIGNPEGDDFPLQKGKERLMQAEFRGSLGQAFTDRYGDFEGTLNELFSMSLENNYRRAVFVAGLNAFLRHLGFAEGTIHCRDKGPSECAKIMAAHIRRRYGLIRIAQIGFQPRIAEAMAKEFTFRLLDLDPDNIGKNKFGVRVEGPEKTNEAVAWAELLLVTGTTLVNDTIASFLKGKHVIFYGTTIAGTASLMGWDRFCARAS